MKKQLLASGFALLITTQFAFATVIKDADGWTVITPSSDSRIVYVSNSTGNDINNGLSAATAKKTIAAGAALIRDTYPDHLLLMKGDTFANQNFGWAWAQSGRSVSEPILIGSYGAGERPKILTGNSYGFRNQVGQLYSGSNLAIIGLYFEPHTRQPSDPTATGISIAAQAKNVIIENCYITGYSGNISLGAGGMNHNLQIRRNIITNAYSTSSHSQGMYSAGADTLIIEGNLFDHNGWIQGSNTSTPSNQGGPTMFNHSMYITHHNRNVSIIGNISSRPASIGLKFQPTGGTHYITNNLFVQCGCGLQCGGGQAAEQVGYTGATIYANDNIITEGNNNPAGGMGVGVTNVNAGSFSNNIIANKAGTGNQFALSLQDGMGWESMGWGIRNFAVDNNVIYNWRGTVRIVKPTQSYSLCPLPIIDNVSFRNNILQEPNSGGTRLVETYTADSTVAKFRGTAYYSTTTASDWFRIVNANRSFTQWKDTVESTAVQQQTTFTDPTRSVTNYATTVLGLSNYDQFMDSLKEQSKDNWRGAYSINVINCWIREGFDMGTCSTATSISSSQVERKNILVYPNPAINELNFQLEKNTAETLGIYDITGKTIETISINSQDQITLSTEHYISGIYFYMLIDHNTVFYKGKFSVIK